MNRINATITLTAIPRIPLIRSGDDLAGIILTALEAAGMALVSGDVLAITSKIVSKAENRQIRLNDVTASAIALEVAEQCEKDPRLVQVVLDESQEVSRLRPGLLIVKHRLGFVCANAGVDRSNVGANAEEEEMVLLLPQDPDGSAERLRRQIREATGADVAVIIVDSHGRPHRMGTVGRAIGAAGLPALEDCRGRPDLFGRPLEHTQVGLADQIAAAASLLFGQAAEGTPVVRLQGVHFQPSEGQASDLVRPLEYDLYR